MTIDREIFVIARERSDRTNPPNFWGDCRAKRRSADPAGAAQVNLLRWLDFLLFRKSKLNGFDEHDYTKGDAAKPEYKRERSSDWS